MVKYRHFNAKPLSGAVGAVLEGIDISRDLDADVVAEIRQAMLDYLVIFFRDLNLSDERLMIFGRYFGELFLHPNLAKTGRYRKEADASRGMILL
jgi:taurine dioxygenase